MTPYRILRLKSGEDIITRIKGKKDSRYIVERPMQMKVSSLIDPEEGLRKDILLLRNWLQYTNHIETTIPEDWVAVILTPDSQASMSYDRAKENEDCNPEVESSVSLPEQEQREEHNFMKNRNNNVEPGSIIVTLAIPPLLFVHLLSQGLLNNNLEDMEMDEEMGPGNNVNDWSPNIEDYFDDED